MARKKRPIWTLDSETDPFLSKADADKRGIPYPRNPQAFLWGLWEGKKEIYHEFREASEVADFFLSEYASDEKPIVYAHNGGKFVDYHALRRWINTDEPIMLIGGRLAKFKIGECEFRDSINILPVGLAAFQKEEIDYSIMEREVRWEPKNYEKISRYLRSDCQNLYDVVTRFQDRFGRGLTQAGACMRYWSKNYNVKAPKQNAANFQRLKPFYYGGRVECFRSGYSETEFKVVDINSAYPRAMLEKHPFSVTPIISDELPSKAEIPQCFIELEGTSQGAFPFVDEAGSLTFPDDDIVRNYKVSGWEYLAGIELGAVSVKKIIRVYSFSEHVDFKDYIEDFFSERLAARASGDKAGDTHAKLAMNGLYGKFASDPARYKEWVIASGESYFDWGTKGFSIKELFGPNLLMSRDVPEERHRYYNIATAASITGYVRAFLYRSLRQCKGAIYCDTDSIAAEDVSSLSLGAALGQWKVEKECKAYAVAGKKLYAFLGLDGSWKTACKGGDLGPEEIVRVAKGEDIEFFPEVPTYTLLQSDPVFTKRVFKNTAKIVAGSKKAA